MTDENNMLGSTSQQHKVPPSFEKKKTKITEGIMNSQPVIENFRHAPTQKMKTDDDVGDGLTSSSSPSEMSPLRLPEKKRCSFKKGSLIIIDDHLTFNANSSNDKATAKEEKDLYHKNLIFIQQLVLVHSHHRGLHAILISQQGLTSFGSSVNAQCLRTIR